MLMMLVMVVIKEKDHVKITMMKKLLFKDIDAADTDNNNKEIFDRMTLLRNMGLIKMD